MSRVDRQMFTPYPTIDEDTGTVGRRRRVAPIFKGQQELC